MPPGGVGKPSAALQGPAEVPENGETMDDRQPPSSAKEELRSFAFLTIVMAPALTGALIVTYGFLVWFYQMFAGPPHV